MKKIYFLFIFLFIILMSPFSVYAQGMMGQYKNSTPDAQNSTTIQEEAKGKEVFDKLQAKQVTCKDLTDDDFDVLGEYFMGQRLGVSHENMNNMMKQMMGEAGETQMHISLGKRLSGCDSTYPIPTTGVNFLPMMGMMNVGNNQSDFGGRGMINGWNNNSWLGGRGYMMGNYFGIQSVFLRLIGLFTWVLVLIFLILGIIYFWKEITGKGRK